MDVISRLKPKVSALGFSKDELELVASQIKTSLKEDATDEQIEAAIDAAIPFLKVSQTAVSRIVNAKKKEEEQQQQQQNATAGNQAHIEAGAGDQQKNDEEPSWFKAYREKQEERINRIEQADVSKSRKTVFEEKIKDLPDARKAMLLRDFNRISFKDDDDFKSYLTEKEEDIKALGQEDADNGLSKMKHPGEGGKGKTETDDFIKTMHDINNNEEKK